jgi:RHS repeat-associated protein
VGRPLVQRQLFKLNGTWSGAYQTSRAYNRAGAVTSQTYPSGHFVTYNYDSAGRLADKDAQNLAFTGNLGDGQQKTYASGNTYSSWGNLTMERFGTQTPLYHKLQYNIRGQLWDVRVATGSDVNGSWNRGCLQMFYESTYTHGASGPGNNGNVLKTNHYVPMDESSSTWAIHDQFYSYDSLNRITSVAEYFISNTQPFTQTSLQTYAYDRWGNRNINATQTWGRGINNKEYTVDSTTNRLGVPGGQSGSMSYDAAGNMILDTYTGAGARTYDAENRMITAADNTSHTSRYTYDADGRRTRRETAGGGEEWQIYGFDGELLAEYHASSPSLPVKEYGYRNGQLLITAEPSSQPPTNVALASNGATASASSSYSGFAASGAINGDRKGLFVGQNGYWSTASAGFPAWLEVQFNGSKTITEIDVVTEQDNYQAPIEPTESATFSQYGLNGYEVQYWNSSAWVIIPGGAVSGNNKVWKKFSFAPLTTTKIRVLANASPDNYSRLTEIEAWTGPSPAPRYNLALASMGAVATASNSYNAGYGPGGANNGDRKSLNWTNGGGWNDSGPPFPDWLQIDFGSVKTINEVDVFTLQDNWANSAEPTESMTFTQWGLTGYQVEYWDESNWVAISGASVTGNNKIWRKFEFSPISTNKIRVVTSASVDGYSRLTEVEAYGPADTDGSGNGVHWLVPDHLGTPRIVLDQTGSLSGVKLHDYLPFGEELFADTGGRTTAMGYTGDGVRQQFTQKERDVETGLDYFINRYYSSTQGRFTSVDPTLGSIDITNPQTLNRYTYALNNPLAYIDPDGLEALTIGSYNDLTDEQKRLFQTYVNNNYSDQIGDMDPADFAARLWNESALIANLEGENAAVGGGPLSQSQLTTFLGVTSMLEARGVSDQVLSITSINGDQKEHNFRIYAELKGADSYKQIYQVFDWKIGGSGHEPYTISRREQGPNGQPNGQVSLTQDRLRIDTDVDYRKLLNVKGHNTPENSDIRADDGDTSHYRLHTKRYGPIPALKPVNETFVRSKK